ncbi:MAG: hypothetical protein KGN32_07425 [Burkholderiales bacterium]|nr:hypothetical protein [Burkholderiales bacterium]
MTSKSLTAITHELIESYGNTAKNVINAYRIGNERAVVLMDQGWASAVHRAGARLSPEVRGNAVAAEKKVTGLYSNAVSLTSDSANNAVGKAVEYAGKGLRQMAANASRFEKATGVGTLNVLAVAVIPAAQAAVEMASKMEARSSVLVDKATSYKTKAKVATVKRTAAKKVARVRKAA